MKTAKHERRTPMKVQGAVIKEQGVTFAIVVVKSHVVRNVSQANKAIQNYRGTPTYYGRRDIVRFLSKLPMHAIPLKQYTFS
jgi:hypothetical protein